MMGPLCETGCHLCCSCQQRWWIERAAYTSQASNLPGITAARSRLRRKIVDEGWGKGVTVEWVEITSSLKKKWCNGVTKYTFLRWAVNQDDDVWLINNDAPTAVPTETPSPPDTQWLRCVSIVYRLITSPPSTIAPLELTFSLSSALPYKWCSR